MVYNEGAQKSYDFSLTVRASRLFIGCTCRDKLQGVYTVLEVQVPTIQSLVGDGTSVKNKLGYGSLTSDFFHGR